MPKEPVKSRYKQSRLALKDKKVKVFRPNGDTKLVERYFKEYKVTPLKAQNRCMSLITSFEEIARKIKYASEDLEATRKALETTTDYMRKKELEDDLSSDSTQLHILKEQVSQTKLNKLLFELLFDHYGRETEFYKRLKEALDRNKQKLLPGTTLLLTLFSYQFELATLGNPKAREISELLQEIGKEDHPEQGNLFLYNVHKGEGF